MCLQFKCLSLVNHKCALHDKTRPQIDRLIQEKDPVTKYGGIDIISEYLNILRDTSVYVL